MVAVRPANLKVERSKMDGMGLGIRQGSASLSFIVLGWSVVSASQLSHPVRLVSSRDGIRDQHIYLAMAIVTAGKGAVHGSVEIYKIYWWSTSVEMMGYIVD